MTRPQFMEAMAERGIAVGVHYPAIHLFTAYRAMGYREGQFPNAERIGRQTVTLPLFPTMELSDVDRVVEAANEVSRERVELTQTLRFGRHSGLQRGGGAGGLFERLYPALDKLGRRYEVIFVDDGSSDRSVAVLREQFTSGPM